MSLLDTLDFFDPRTRRDPYPLYAELREKAPLYWSKQLGAYIVSRYEDVAYALKNAALFSSEGVKISGRDRALLQFNSPTSVSNLLTSDPPLHTRMRGLVSRAFFPKHINALEPRVRELSRGFIDEMVAHPEFDFVTGLSSPLPVTIIAEMLGIESSRRRDFKRWSDGIIDSASERMRTGHVSEENQRNSRDMLEFMTAVAEQRRLEPRGDLVSLLVQETEGVPPLTPAEVNSFAALLLLAGNETTTNLMGNALVSLIRHPEQYAWLRANPTLEACTAVCEETLRYDSPVLSVSRRVTREVELGGGKVPADSTVVLMLASANHDPRKFPNPERYDLQRDTQGLLSFGHGIHFCLGAPLSRLEVPVALEELMQRAPSLGFSPRQPEEIDHGPAIVLRGPRQLWLQRV